MLIGIDASRANEEKKTGVGNYAYFLIQEIKKLEIRNLKLWSEPVRFVLYSRGPLKGGLAKLPENWSVKILRWPPKRLWTQLRLSWEMLWHAPDVLFIPAHVFPIIHPKKTVMTIHDVAALKFPESYNWFERWYSTWSARAALGKLWRVIVPSNVVKQDLISNIQYPIFNCYVVRHGFDQRYSDIKILDIQKILNKYSVRQPYLLSVGRLEEKKNTVRIVEAFNNIKLQLTTYNLQLVLVGPPGHGYSKVQEAIQSSQFKKDIITPGWVGDEDLRVIMKGAEVFVFPSLAEGFGIPILEAMATGVPVLTSNSLQEVGGDACEYVDPMNVGEIASGVLRLLQNANFKMQNIGRGLQRVKEFSWEKCAEETMKVLAWS